MNRVKKRGMKGLHVFSLLTIILSTLVSFRSFCSSSAGVNLSSRHIVILQADLDFIWGHYYFAVVNENDKITRFTVPVMLPEHTIDFKAQDGLNEKDIKLSHDGKVSIEKDFKPGLTLMGMGFKLQIDKWHDADQIVFATEKEVQELSIAVPANSGLQIIGQEDLFTTGLPPMLKGGKYEGIISAKNIAAGQRFSIELNGVPKQRYSFWILGLGAGICLIALGIVLSYVTLGEVRRSIAVEVKR